MSDAPAADFEEAFLDALVELPMLRLSARFEAPLPLAWREPASVLRGALGAELRRTARRPHDGQICPPEACCPYCTMFEPQPRRSEAGSLTPPHPLIVSATEAEWASGRFDIALVGAAARFADPVVASLERIFERGLGARTIRGRITSWTTIGAGGDVDPRGAPINVGADVRRRVREWRGAPSMQLWTVSPVRLTAAINAEPRLSPRALTFAAARRAASLAAYFGGGAPALPLTQEMIAAAEEVRPLEEAWRWKDGVRFSARQRRDVPLGGVVGHGTYSGWTEPLLAVLGAGVVLGVGKSCSFGLGRLSARAKECPPAAD